MVVAEVVAARFAAAQKYAVTLECGYVGQNSVGGDWVVVVAGRVAVPDAIAYDAPIRKFDKRQPKYNRRFRAIEPNNSRNTRVGVRLDGDPRSSSLKIACSNAMSGSVCK